MTNDELFLAHFPALRRLAAVLVGDTAVGEEIAMDAFVGAWRRLGSVDRPEAYLRRAVVNLSCSRVRRWAAERRAQARSGAGAGAVPSSVPPWDPVADERARAVAAAVAALPARQRACVVLHYFEDLGVAEVAGVLGCAPGTVKSQLSKARATLGSSLQSYAEEVR